MTTAELAAVVDRLAGLDSDAVDDAERIDRVRLLERLKSAAAAVQADHTATFAASQEDGQRAAGVPARRVGQGIAAQVGLARRESPARAARYVGWAKALVGDLPHTYAALQRGETSEWRAMIVARETIWLPEREHRAAIDADLGPRFGGLGDRQVEAEAKRLGYRLDPHGYLARSRAVAKDRRVTIRPAPDTMTRLTALLPVAEGVAAFAALARAADTARSSGDGRGRGQVMADTLVERVTGQTSADAVPVEIGLVMTDRTLLGRSGEHSPGADEPGQVVGYGPVPAGLARDLAASNDTKVWIRRLYTNPETGRLVAMESKRRRFKGKQRQALIIRDQFCRAPWCDALIRHADHATPVEHGGTTSFENGQGLCEACNYAKHAPGWSTRPGSGGTSESVITTTPTGHTYNSRPPSLPSQPCASEPRDHPLPV